VPEHGWDLAEVTTEKRGESTKGPSHTTHVAQAAVHRIDRALACGWGFIPDEQPRLA
jgi:hypothetical protein